MNICAPSMVLSDTKSHVKVQVNILEKLNKCLLSIYYFLGIVLSARNKKINKSLYGIYYLLKDREHPGEKPVFSVLFVCLSVSGRDGGGKLL